MRVICKQPRIVLIEPIDINDCPMKSEIPEHYRDDGTCRCYPDTREKARSDE